VNFKKNIPPFVLVTALTVLYVAELYWVYTVNFAACEDAYITFRFAENLAKGLGPVFNPGEAVEGYSNFLWMVFLSASYRLGFDMETVSRLAGAVLNTLAVFLVWYIPRRHFSVRGTSAFLGPLLYLLFLPFHFYATSGLETTLYLFCILLCTHTVLWAGARPFPFVLAAFSLLITALVRPEGILLCVFLCAYLLWRCVFRSGPWKPYLPGILLFAIGYGAFLLWRIDYYGLPFPNTYYAKGSFPFFIRAALGFIMNKGFITHYAYLPLFLLAVLGFVKTPEGYPRDIVLLFLCTGLLFSLAFSGFDWMPFFRYTLPVVPLLIILCQTCFFCLWQKISTGGALRQKLIWSAITAVFILAAAEQFLYDASFTLQWNKVNRYAMYNQKTMGLWMKEALGSEPLIAVGDVGRLAYFSHATVMDIFGLTNRDIALLRKHYGSPEIILPGCTISFDHYKEKERELLLEMKPDYIFFYNAHLKITDAFPGSADGIVEHPDFLEQYDYMDSFSVVPRFTSPYWPKLHYCIEVLDLSAGLLTWMRDGWGYDIYRRKDSPFKRFTIHRLPDGRIKNIVAG